MSPKSAGLAVKAGYKNVKVYRNGIPDWKSKHILVADTQHVKESNIILIDLRDASAYKQGHIPRAHHVALKDMQNLEDDLPENRGAPIVFYGPDSKKGYDFISKLGYKKVAIYQQGTDGWVAAGNELVTGESPKEIVWKRIIGKGEISVAEFNKVVKENPEDSLILDVRTKGEAADGTFKNAVHIPLDELKTNLGNLSKDKEILVYCANGARAEMAYNELKGAGFKTRFLLSEVECDEDGCEASTE